MKSKNLVRKAECRAAPLWSVDMTSGDFQEGSSKSVLLENADFLSFPVLIISAPAQLFMLIRQSNVYFLEKVDLNCV